MMKTSKKSEKTKTNFFSKINQKNKKLLICAAAIVIILLGAFAAVTFIPSKNYTVAFYNIEEKQKNGIKDTLEQIAEKQKMSIAFREYDSEKSLKDQLLLSKKPELIITTSGYGVDMATEKASSRASLSKTLLLEMSSSMKNAAKSAGSGDNLSAIPFLSSHLEVDIATADFQESNTKKINTWNDVEKFMREQKNKKEAPLVFAGGNNDSFLNIMGALAESIDGIESYNDAIEIIKKNGKNPARTAAKLCDDPDSPLATSVKLLTTWYKYGLIHPGVFSFQKNDVEAFAASRLSSVLFMSLENHRAFAQNAISRFTSIYFPSEHGANSRIFTGTVYYAVPMIKSKKTETIMKYLVSTEIQEELSRTTGVAPVLAHCRTPDKQANDARYWIAATTTPLPGLANEVYLTKNQKNTIAAEIIARIKK